MFFDGRVFESHPLTILTAPPRSSCLVASVGGEVTGESASGGGGSCGCAGAGNSGSGGESRSARGGELSLKL